MKTAIYIANGVTQVVLTPEHDLEKDLVKRITEQHAVTIRKGSFYECNGGWTRHANTDESLMLIVNEPQ